MLDKISRVIFISVLIELCLGGGGRLTAFGPISLRMILFGLGITWAGFLLLKGRTIPSRLWKLFFLFLIILAIGILTAVLNNNFLPSLWEDVKPLLYFLMLPFFGLVIKGKEIEIAGKVIKGSSMFMVALFFLFFLLINLGIIPFLSFYKATEKSVEFFYRGELSFFYKGFLFFGIGALFYYFSESKNRYVFISLLVLAIIISVTRGLLFSLAVTFAIIYLGRSAYYKIALSILIAIAFVIWGNPIISSVSRWVDATKQEESATASPYLFGDKDYSDAGRITQLKEVVDRTSFSSIFIGHGFGQGIPSRPVHMEISYLEIFHKQGILGLVFWGVFAYRLLVLYRKSPPSLLANAYFFTSLFVFIESATNQYFNNPIGMSILLLSLVSLDKLGNQS